jgi:hypothetical protein
MFTGNLSVLDTGVKLTYSTFDRLNITTEPNTVHPASTTTIGELSALRSHLTQPTLHTLHQDVVRYGSLGLFSRGVTHTVAAV